MEGIVSHLEYMTEQDIEALVAAEVRGSAPDGTAEMLREDEHLDRWAMALTNLKRSVEAQLAEREAHLLAFEQDCRAMGFAGKDRYHRYKADHLRWRASAVRFKGSIEARLQSVKLLRRERDMRLHDARDAYKGDVLMQVERLLRRVHDLEERVAHLEGRPSVGIAAD